jgi:hypothetical protein
MTRKQALDKAAKQLERAENNTLTEGAVSKALTLAQLYMSLAHEIGEPSIVNPNV